MVLAARTADLARVNAALRHFKLKPIAARAGGYVGAWRTAAGRHVFLVMGQDPLAFRRAVARFCLFDAIRPGLEGPF